MSSAPLTPIAIAFLLGVLIGMCVPVMPLLLIGCMVVSAALLIWQREDTRGGALALLVIWVCLGMLRAHVWVAHPASALAEAIPSRPQPVQLHGIITTDPVPPLARNDSDRTACVIRLLHRRTTEGWEPIAGGVRATFDAPMVHIDYGDEVLVAGEWSRPSVPSNPGQYDWSAALGRRRIHGSLSVKPFHGLVILRHDRGIGVLGTIFHLRRRWKRLLRDAFAPQESGLLISLLLGERVALDERIKNSFVETGTIHLLVISGFNVGLIALLIDWGLRPFGMPWRRRLVCSAAGLAVYAMLAGAAPPVVRATIMAWIVLGAAALDQVLSWPNALAAAALAIVGLEPAQLFDPGFQLSFGAVLSLIVFASRWHARVEPGLGWLHPAWLRRYVCANLSATASVWLGLAPVLAWYFQLVTPVSVLANLLIAPLVSALVMLGTALLMLGTLYAPLVQWGSGLLNGLLHATIACVFWCHALPGAYWFVPPPSLWSLFLYYGFLALVLVKDRLKFDRTRVFVCGVAACAVWMLACVAARLVESRWVRLDVLDVGRGQSVLVRTPGRRAILVGAGSQDAGRSVVVPFLRASGLRSLDALALPALDGDMAAGAVPLFKALQVKRLLTNGSQDDTMSARALRRYAIADAISEAPLSAGTIVLDDRWGAVKALHPPREGVPGSLPGSKDNSAVLSVERGDVRVLLCGAVGERGLTWLLQHVATLQAHVIVLPARQEWLSPAGERLFDAVHPQTAILSAGSDDRVAMMQIAQRLMRRGAVCYVTARDGAVRLRTDGRRVEIRAFNRSSPPQQFEVH